jgi:hypothetical protein
MHRTFPKGVKARPGKRKATREEERWIKAALDFGCWACVMDGHAPRPTAYHHVVIGNRRLGHLFGYGLCDPGHHQNGQALGLISRHPHKAQFEARYGTDMEITGHLKVRLGFFASYEVTA